MDIEGIFWYHLGDSKEVEKMRFFWQGGKTSGKFKILFCMILDCFDEGDMDLFQ